MGMFNLFGGERTAYEIEEHNREQDAMSTMGRSTELKKSRRKRVKIDTSQGGVITFRSHEEAVEANAKADLALSALRSLPEELRLMVFGHFCRGCGVEDPSCQCWNDE